MKKKSYYQSFENSWSQDYFLYGQTPFSTDSMTFLFRADAAPIHESFKNHEVAIKSSSSSAILASPIISVGPSLIESTDAAGGISTTYSLLVGQTAQGVISSKGDHDYYKINLVAGQAYTFAEIGTGVSALKDTYLSIRDSSGKSVSFNDDSGPGLSSLLTYTPTKSGVYYIDAGAYGNQSTGQYGLSVTSGSKASFDIPMGAGALDSYNSWTSINAANAVTVTYGFRSSAPTSYTPPSNFSILSKSEIDAVKSILGLWSDVANVKFTEISDTTINGLNEYSNNATIEIANYSANDGAGAFAYYPGSTSASSSAGDLWLNLSGGVTTNGVTPGTYPYFAIMHELGHALGLSHPGDYNAGSGSVITYSNSAQFIQDSEQYSVMSYFGGANTGATPGGFATGYTPMLLDVYELQQLYGANTSTRTGNDTYGFNSTLPQYTFSSSTPPQLCIWDGGGSDTLECSAYSSSQNISLAQGTFSSVDGGVNNVSIALGCFVENAIGGAGNDTILGNEVSNVLTGGAGADHFVFNTKLNASTNVDRITDFNIQEDNIDLSLKIFDKLSTSSASNFLSGAGVTTAANTSNYLIYNTSTGTLYYDADGSGTQAAPIQFAIIDNHSQLTWANFTLIA